MSWQSVQHDTQTIPEQCTNAAKQGDVALASCSCLFLEEGSQIVLRRLNLWFTAAGWLWDINSAKAAAITATEATRPDYRLGKEAAFLLGKPIPIFKNDALSGH